jgi:hypothetical protein
MLNATVPVVPDPVTVKYVQLHLVCCVGVPDCVASRGNNFQSNFSDLTDVLSHHFPEVTEYDHEIRTLDSLCHAAPTLVCVCNPNVPQVFDRTADCVLLAHDQFTKRPDIGWHWEGPRK